MLFEEFDSGVPEAQIKITEDHFSANHPGKMDLKRDLGEADAYGENLFGTNGDMGQNFDCDYLDAYIDERHTMQTRSYFIYGQDLFKFLHNRFGGHIFKRYYIRKGGSYYTTAEVHLKQIKTMFLNANLLLSG